MQERIQRFYGGGTGKWSASHRITAPVFVETFMCFWRMRRLRAHKAIQHYFRSKFLSKKIQQRKVRQSDSDVATFGKLITVCTLS